jgi:hypothetical protein
MSETKSVKYIDDNEIIITHINEQMIYQQANIKNNGCNDILHDFINITRKTLARKYKMNPKSDDMNEMIADFIIKRLKLGQDRYSHGIRIYDDTTKYGTEENDWLLMALEEMLDGIIYITAAHFRDIDNTN